MKIFEMNYKNFTNEIDEKIINYMHGFINNQIELFSNHSDDFFDYFEYLNELNKYVQMVYNKIFKTIYCNLFCENGKKRGFIFDIYKCGFNEIIINVKYYNYENHEFVYENENTYVINFNEYMENKF